VEKVSNVIITLRGGSTHKDGELAALEVAKILNLRRSFYIHNDRLYEVSLECIEKGMTTVERLLG